ncbi:MULTISPECIES: hypothetical protein [Klebsiella]|uniref:hypothetical protein n=1 Tax=Klebsiella TaxID=570 RepID=UPI0032B3CE95
MTDITELTSVQKNANIHRLSRLIAYASNDELRQMAVEVEIYTDRLIEALEKAKGMEDYWKTQCRGITDHCEELQQRIAELESSCIAPGILRCTECSFVLTKNIINVAADTITTGISEPEPCPNGCGQLQPVTWKALAIHLMFTTKQGLSDLLEAKKRIAELESKLANPVQLPKKNGYWTETEKAYEEAITLAKRQIRLAGFTVEDM